MVLDVSRAAPRRGSPRHDAAAPNPGPEAGPRLALLSPAALMIGAWGGAAAVAAAILADPDRFDLAHYFIRKHLLDLGAFSPSAALWLAMMLGAFVAGCGLADAVAPARLRPATSPSAADRAAAPLFAVNLALVGVTLLWVMLSAARIGGLGALVLLTRADAYGAREVLLDAKLFEGMRMFYGALPATGAMAAALLALGTGSTGSRRLCLAVLASDIAVLTVLPLIMSQRLLLVQLLVAAPVAACLVRRRIVGLRWLPVLAGLFLATWILHEAVTNPDIDRGAVSLGAQRLGFYVVNDLWNSVRPIQEDAHHFGGYWSLRAAQVFTLTDGWLDGRLADPIAAARGLRGGGEFSVLSGPWVDFGTMGAALYLLAAGALAQALFRAGQGRAGAAAAYGQVAAALLVSTHGNYFAQQDFWFGMALTGGIAAWAGAGSPAGTARGAAHA